MMKPRKCQIEVVRGRPIEEVEPPIDGYEGFTFTSRYHDKGTFYTAWEMDEYVAHLEAQLAKKMPRVGIYVRFIGGPHDGQRLNLSLPISTHIELPVVGELAGRLQSMALYQARVKPGLLEGTFDFDAYVYVESRAPISTGGGSGGSR